MCRVKWALRAMTIETGSSKFELNFKAQNPFISNRRHTLSSFSHGTEKWGKRQIVSSTEPKRDTHSCEFDGAKSGAPFLICLRTQKSSVCMVLRSVGPSLFA